MENDHSWIKDGVPVFFTIKGPYAGTYSGNVDGPIKDIGGDGHEHLVVRLKNVSKDYERITHCKFACCVPITCLSRVTVRKERRTK